MTTHHTSLYDDETNPAPATVLKQELFTTEQTEYGVRVTKLKRQFSVNGSTDSYESEPIPLNRRAQLWEKLCLTASKKLMTRFSDRHSNCLPQANLGKALSGQHLKNTRLLTHCNTVANQITLKLTNNFSFWQIAQCCTALCFISTTVCPTEIRVR